MTSTGRRPLLRALFALGLASALGGCLHTRTPAIPVESTAPEFSLLDQTGRAVSLDALVKNGPAVLVFYRGFW